MTCSKDYSPIAWKKLSRDSLKTEWIDLVNSIQRTLPGNLFERLNGISPITPEQLLLESGIPYIPSHFRPTTDFWPPAAVTVTSKSGVSLAWKISQCSMSTARIYMQSNSHRTVENYVAEMGIPLFYCGISSTVPRTKKVICISIFRLDFRYWRIKLGFR